MKTIKIKLVTATLLAGCVLQQLALSQTNTAATDQPGAATMAGNEPAAAPAVAIESNAPATGSESMAPAGSVSASDATVSSSPATNAAAMMESASQPAKSETAGTNAAAAVKVPIQFQDVPITTAIESLARLAGINYVLDPKIGYGQPDANGVIKPEPTLSIRWDNVTAEQALLALLDNYGLQMISNAKTGIAKITPKEPNALPPLITRVVQLKYASTSNMEIAVESVLTDKQRSRVVPDARTSQLVIVATDPEQTAVDTLLNQLDKPTRQVLIETHLVEISSNPSTSKGMDWSGTLAAQNISSGNNALPSLAPQPAIPASAGPPPTLAQPATQGTIGGVLSGPNLIGSLNKGPFFNPSQLFLNADGVHAVLSFLNQSAEAQVSSVPRVVTLDNETATISVTRSFPIINVTAGTANTAGGSTITYSNIGTVLEVTPRITANDYILLRVVPDVSSFFGTVSKSVGGSLFQADEFDSRHIETQVLIPNAHTLVMGGLVKDNPNSQFTKVPILGDIPVLGLAFRHENKSMEKDNLLIFITPTIVQDADYKPTTTDFLNSQPRIMKDPMNPHTLWDSAQPAGDWSNPIQSQDEIKVQNASGEKTVPLP